MRQGNLARKEEKLRKIRSQSSRDWPGPPTSLARKRGLFGGNRSIDLEGQPGNLPGGGIAMEDPTIDGMVDKGDDPHESLFCLVGLSRGNGFFNLAGKSAHGGNGLTVAVPTLGISSDIFFCRLVIRQRSSLLTAY